VGQRLTGKVIEATESGDLRTDITEDMLEAVPRDDRLWISCAGHRTNCLFDAAHNEPEMTYLAMISSDGHLVLTLVGDSAYKFLGIRAGNDVVLTWD